MGSVSITKELSWDNEIHITVQATDGFLQLDEDRDSTTYKLRHWESLRDEILEHDCHTTLGCRRREVCNKLFLIHPVNPNHLVPYLWLVCQFAVEGEFDETVTFTFDDDE